MSMHRVLCSARSGGVGQWTSAEERGTVARVGDDQEVRADGLWGKGAEHRHDDDPGSSRTSHSSSRPIDSSRRTNALSAIHETSECQGGHQNNLAGEIGKFCRIPTTRMAPRPDDLVRHSGMRLTFSI